MLIMLQAVRLSNCTSASAKWQYEAATKTVKPALLGGCLVTSAVSTGMLRVSVSVAPSGSPACDGASPSGQWIFSNTTGFITSAITNNTGVDTPYAAGRAPLCLALRSEGQFNTAA